MFLVFIFYFLYKKFWLLLIFCYVIVCILLKIWFVYMKNEIRTSIVWAALAFMSNSGLKAHNFVSENNLWWDKIKSELYNSLGDRLDAPELQWSLEAEFLSPIDATVITNAALSYFDEEVKLYSLKWKSRERVVSILNSYLVAHPVLVVWDQWGMNFVISNKEEFCRMVKEIVNVIINDMPFLVRKVWVALFFGWNDKLQEKLDNLENTIFTMKEKQYKDIVFDYIWWIVKRVEKSVGWKMTVKQYYDDLSKYFPNKNSANISQELFKTWKWNVDIKYMNYPFKK